MNASAISWKGAAIPAPQYIIRVWLVRSGSFGLSADVPAPGWLVPDALLFAEAAVCSCLASVWSWAVAEGAAETAGEPASLPFEHPPNMDAPSDAAKKIANVLFFIVIPSN